MTENEAASVRRDADEWSFLQGVRQKIAEKRLAHDPSVAKCVERAR